MHPLRTILPANILLLLQASSMARKPNLLLADDLNGRMTQWRERVNARLPERNTP